MNDKRWLLTLIAMTSLTVGCVAPSDGDGDVADDGEPEVVGTSAEEQALTINGCTFHAQAIKDWQALGTAYFGRATLKCTTRRSVTIGTCIDRWNGSSYVAYKCSGAKSIVAQTTSNWYARTDSAFARGQYRVRVRLDGYGTTHTYFGI
jgi:hypothetical protein